ncbi:urease accessory protein UreD [Actinosynnema sp. NPDC053489]|uniref:urease accessory protein UreD n=1 Tax=Actinosynnema sp. NPDC053489 TaxID=3363916 RepID=UPI0037CC26FA
MRARAHLVVERDPNGRTFVREVRSMAPLRLMPRPGRAEVALVHLVSAVTAPLGGDDLELRVTVGVGAALELRGVAATVALPGQHPGGSRALVDVELGDGASLSYLPEPTVVTARAHHESVFRARMGEGSRLRAREIVVLGRSNERPGSLTTTLDVRRNGPVIKQTSHLGTPEVDASPAGLAGRRVFGTELLCWDDDLPGAISEDWWSLVPLARGGSLSTALGDDAVTVERALDEARARHPGWNLTRSLARFRGGGHTESHGSGGGHHHSGGFAPAGKPVPSADR